MKTVIEKDRVNNKSLFLVITLGFALGMRQMAMSMVMPFISTYSRQLVNYTPSLSGIALGIFGLMQAVFQIPYGIWSDKKGNKLVMATALMQVIAGLFIAYFATNIYTLIFARALQGSGAVLAVGYSWVSSSVTDSKERLQSMIILTMIISGVAAATFAFGSLFNKFISVRNMFLYSALLILCSCFIVIIFLKDNNFKKSTKTIKTRDAMKMLLKNKCFIALNILVFINNFIDIGIFYAVPQYLENITGIDGMWVVFMPAVLIAIVIMKTAVKKLTNHTSIYFLIFNFVITALCILLYLNKTSLLFIFIGTVLAMIGYISIATVIPTL